MNKQVSCVSPCADLNALGALESYYSGRTSDKWAGPARGREFFLSLTLSLDWISGFDRNERLLVWSSVHHTAGSPTRNSMVIHNSPSPLPFRPVSTYLICCIHTIVFIFATKFGTLILPDLPWVALHLALSSNRASWHFPFWVVLFPTPLPRVKLRLSQLMHSICPLGL